MHVFAILAATAIGTSTVVPCTRYDVRGEWILSLSPASLGYPSNCAGGDRYDFRVELALPNTAFYLKYTHPATGALSDVEGTWTMVDEADALEIIADGRVFFVPLSSGCNESMSGTWRDADAELWGCLRATRRELPCTEGAGCHAISSMIIEGGTELGIDSGAGVRESPPSRPAATALVPPDLVDEPSSGTEDDAVDAARSAVEVVNSAGLTWKAAVGPPERLASLRQLWGGVRWEALRSSTAPLPNASSAPRAAATPPPSPPSSPPSSLPPSLDWRSFRGISWVSPVVDVLDGSMPAACPAAAHVLAVLASVEARVRIASNLTQSESLSVADALSCRFVSTPPPASPATSMICVALIWVAKLLPP